VPPLALYASSSRGVAHVLLLRQTIVDIEIEFC
jgi:hypothetical protein